MRDETRRVRTILTADDRSRPALDSASLRLQSLARQSTMVGVAFAGAAVAAGAGLTLLVKNSLEAADALAKSADRAGISTESWAGMQIAADRAGVSHEQLANSVRRLSGTVADAGRGNERAAETFRRIGLDADELRRQRPEKTFEAVVEKLSVIPDAYERSRIAAELFGERNTGVMAITAEGLRSAGELADAFGLSISRVDAAKIEQANDAMSDLKKFSAGVGRTMAVVVAPYLEVAANYLKDMAIESGGFRDEIGTAMDVAVGGAVATAQGFLGVNYTVSEVVRNALRLRQVFWEALRDARELDVSMRDRFNFFGLGDSGLENAERILHEQELILHGINKSLKEATDVRDTSLRMYMDLPAKAAEFRSRVLEASERAAGRVARDRPRHVPVIPEDPTMTGGTTPSAGQTDLVDREAERYRDQLMGRLDSLRQSLLSEEDAIRNSHHQRLTMLYEARSEGLLSQQEFGALEIQLAQERADALAEIEAQRRRRDLDDEQNLWNLKAQAANQGTNAMMNLSNALFAFSNQKSRKLFELNKIAGIAESIVSTYTGAAMALRSVPYPYNLAAAATVVAQGMANVAQIKSTQFGSAAAAGGFGGGTPGSPIVTQPLPQQEQRPAAPVINVSIYGHVVDNDSFAREVIPSLTKALSDGMELARA